MSAPTKAVEAERAKLDAAATAVQEAEVFLAKASTLLGQTTRRGWWFEINKLYHGAHKMAEILDEAATS